MKFSALFLGVLFLFIFPTQAHFAATGWKYDYDCCGDRHCRMALKGEIKKRQDFWLVTRKDGYKIKVGWDDGRIRESHDRFWHICWIGGTLQCIYKPPVEF